MARIPINLRGVAPAGDFAAYPVGRYRLRVIQTRVDTSKSSGELMLVTKYEILHGPDGSMEFAGRPFTRFYSLQPQAAMFLRRATLAMGITDEMLPADGSLDEDMLLGCEIEGQMAISEQKGKERNELTEYPVTGSAAAAQGAHVPPNYPQGHQQPNQPIPQGFQPPPGYPQPVAQPSYPQYAPPAAYPQYAPPPPPQQFNGPQQPQQAAVPAPPPPPPPAPRARK